uniref:Zgc:154075 n=1 Tax=Latimeria chalumnae TaxID=7897 RepID=H3A2N7_LATCH
MATRVTVVIIGAGNRGQNYSNFALDFPDKMRVVGVADPRWFARNHLQKLHKIGKENVFTDWRGAAEREKFADAVVIATPDRLHRKNTLSPAVAFAKKGYHIMLEKPMAVTAEDCKGIVSVCRESGVMLAVCHVLRYFPLKRKSRELLASGILGDVIHIQHMEPVGFWHFAHSFVRGNWRKEEESSFSLLAKSCHDIDLITYWMGDRRCLKVSSFGSLSHFTKDHKPEGAADRCMDCAAEETCPYSAKKIYLDSVKQGQTGWPVSVLCKNGSPDIEAVAEALRSGPYGRCAYDCDNDVVTNQVVVNMEFEGGATVAFTMIAFTEKICERSTRVYGTKGDMNWAGLDWSEWKFVGNKTVE